MPARPPEPDAVEAAILAALDDAGLAGLCAEGRIEAAVGAVAQRWPALDRASLVEAVIEAERTRGGAA